MHSANFTLYKVVKDNMENSGRTKKNVVGGGGDDTEAPKAPQLLCRVLHRAHNGSGGKTPYPPVILALIGKGNITITHAQSVFEGV